MLWTAPIVLALALATAAIGDFREVGRSMSQLGAGGWALILGLSLVNYGLRYLRWSLYLSHLGHQLRHRIHALYYIAGFALTTTPGKAGEAIRTVYLGRHAVAATDSLAAFFSERFMDIVTIVLLGLLAAPILGEYWWLAPVVGGIALLLLAIVHLRTPREALQNFWTARADGRLRRFALSSLRGADNASRLLGGRLAVTGLGLGVIAWGAEGLALAIILDGLGVPVDVTLAIGIYAISVLAGAVSMFPGGLGSTETVMVLLLGSCGVPTSTAIAATLICRIATLWFAVALGAGSMMLIPVLRDARRAKSREALS